MAEKLFCKKRSLKISIIFTNFCSTFSCNKESPSKFFRSKYLVKTIYTTEDSSLISEFNVRHGYTPRI